MQGGIRAQGRHGVTRGERSTCFLEVFVALFSEESVLRDASAGAASAAMAVSSAPTRRVCFARQDRVENGGKIR